jgi:hypothetical protein
MTCHQALSFLFHIGIITQIRTRGESLRINKYKFIGRGSVITLALCEEESGAKEQSAHHSHYGGLFLRRQSISAQNSRGHGSLRKCQPWVRGIDKV